MRLFCIFMALVLTVTTSIAWWGSFGGLQGHDEAVGGGEGSSPYSSDPAQADLWDVYNMEVTNSTPAVISRNLRIMTSTAAVLKYIVGTNVTNRVEHAVDVDGSTAFLTDSTVITDFTAPTQFTVSCWVYLDELTDLDCMWSINEGGADELSVNIGLGDDSLYGGTNDIFVTYNDGSEHRAYTTNDVLSRSTWYNIIYWYDGSQGGNAGRLKLYVDNVSQTLTYLFTVPQVMRTASRNAFVSLSATGAKRMDGRLDDLRIYNKALTAAQLTWIYNNTHPTNNLEAR